MNYQGYLPSENQYSCLNKATLKVLWPNSMIVKGLGVKNENEAREIFRLYPQLNQEFENENYNTLLQLNERKHSAIARLQVVSSYVNNSKHLLWNGIHPNIIRESKYEEFNNRKLKSEIKSEVKSE